MAPPSCLFSVLVVSVLYREWMDCCLTGGKTLHLILLLKGIRSSSWNLQPLLAWTFPRLGHERKRERGIGDFSGITMISHNRPHTCQCQSAGTAESQGDFSGWGFGCSPDGFSSLEARMLNRLRAPTAFPLIPPHSRLGWLWSSQPSSFVAPTLISRRFKD